MIYIEDISGFSSVIKNKKGILASIDYGRVKTGFAISDEKVQFAMPLEIIETLEIKNRIDKITSEYNIKGFVIGYPKTYDGESLHDHAQDCLIVANYVKSKFGIDVLMWDETNTTRESRERIFNMENDHILNPKNPEKLKSRKKKKLIEDDDHYAAQFLLEMVIELL